MSVDDYTLRQFQAWVGKKIPYNPRDKKMEKLRREQKLLQSKEREEDVTSADMG